MPAIAETTLGRERLDVVECLADGLADVPQLQLRRHTPGVSMMNPPFGRDSARGGFVVCRPFESDSRMSFVFLHVANHETD